MRSRSVTVLAAVLLLVAGCSSADDQDPGPEQSQPPAALSDEALLGPSEMPVWTGAGAWVAVDDSQALRACPLPSADSLGASLVLTRTYSYEVELSEGETADPAAEAMLGVNEVAVWPDETAASGAVEAWTTALAECDASPLGTVEGGSTWTVAARDEDSEDGSWFDFTGMAAQGSTTTVVGFALYGQDANVEGDPLADSMQASLARLP